MKQSVYSVTQVNHYVNNMLTKDALLSKLLIKGEVSNCKYHTSGHIYFSLKDEAATISCVMFKNSRRGLAFVLKDGDKVVVGGKAGVYGLTGQYQIYAEKITLEGLGVLYERFLALKQELEDMGMFADEYKQPIPKFIKKLGVVTAPTGDAVQDIRAVAARRNPYVQIILYPAQVQGKGAKESIVQGIQTLDAFGVDTIIVGRGGGSYEDLWAFNEVEVARAIFECSTPVISGVGHGPDYTIADFVADRRAATPTEAAEFAVDDYRGMYDRLQERGRQMHKVMAHQIQLQRNRYDQTKVKLGYLNPEYLMREKRQRLMDQEERIQGLMEKKIMRKRHQFELYIERLKGLSPLSKLNGGYAYVEDDKQRGVKRLAQVQTGDQLTIHISEGTIQTEVKAIQHLEERK